MGDMQHWRGQWKTRVPWENREGWQVWLWHVTAGKSHVQITASGCIPFGCARASAGIVHSGSLAQLDGNTAIVNVISYIGAFSAMTSYNVSHKKGLFNLKRGLISQADRKHMCQSSGHSFIFREVQPEFFLSFQSGGLTLRPMTHSL